MKDLINKYQSPFSLEKVLKFRQLSYVYMDISEQTLNVEKGHNEL